MDIDINYLRYKSHENDLYPVKVNARNARVSNLPPWKDMGFELVNFDPGINDWYDPDEIEIYKKKLADWGLEHTGADFVFSTENFCRTTDPDTEGWLAPIKNAHNDITPELVNQISGYLNYVNYNEFPERILHHTIQHSKKDNIADNNKIKRIIILQFWRNIGNSNPISQMAWCDPKSVHPLEIRTNVLRRNSNDTHASYGSDDESDVPVIVLQKRPSTNHQWYYYSEMQSHEMVVFRVYDSDLKDTKQWLTPHAAFDCATGNGHRHSVEGRIFCLFF